MQAGALNTLDVQLTCKAEVVNIVVQRAVATPGINLDS